MVIRVLNIQHFYISYVLMYIVQIFSYPISHFKRIRLYLNGMCVPLR